MEAAQILAEILKLPHDERLFVADRLWEEISVATEAVPLSSRERTVLDRRLDAYLAAPEAVKPWSEVRDEVLSSL